MTFEELDHTADVRMKISAESFEELLSEAGFALAETLYGEYPKESSKETFTISVEGETAEEFIVNFLSELLFLMEVEYLVPQKISVECAALKVRGEVSGVFFDAKKHSGGTGVKGVSYSGLSLRKTSSGYELIILFDI